MIEPTAGLDAWVSIILAGAAVSMSEIAGDPVCCRRLAEKHDGLVSALFQAMENVEMALGRSGPNTEDIQ